jgi:hypothetical protein
MNKNAIIALLSALIIMVLACWYVTSRPAAPSAPEESFSSDGYVTRDNPGQESGVWYLTYERPGGPGLSAVLSFDGIAAPELVQGERVHVEGILKGSVLSVRSIAPVMAETGTRIKLYYYNPALDQGPGGTQCTAKGLVVAERVIPKTSTPLTDALRLLLRGELSEEERVRGLTTEFPLPGVSLANASIANGVATLTFADPNNKTSGGACRAAVLRAQIEATAKQFPSVSSVRIVPEGLFQP